MIVFVLIVVPQNKFMQKEEIWDKKKTVNKSIKEEFQKECIHDCVSIHDSFKEIFIEVRDHSRLKEVTTKFSKLMESKKIPPIHTLAFFLK